MSQTPTVNVVDFYCSRIKDHRGRSLDDLQDQNHDALEANHDYIQWLFPLPEPSQFNPDAPLLTEADMAAFRSNPALRQKLITSFRIVLRFYGVDAIAMLAGVQVLPTPDYEAQIRNWLTPHNHNYLRITRILRCLSLCGLEHLAQALLKRLEIIYQQHAEVIGEETMNYWRDAVNGAA